MIVDTRTKYRVIDAATGEPVTEQYIFYADDESGVYRYYVPDSQGLPHCDRDGKSVTAEIRKPIRIVEVGWFRQSNFL